MLRFDVLTLFGDMFQTVTEQGVSGRAHQQGRWRLQTWNPRDYTLDVHRTVDDRPYGGGPGMVMLAEPLAQALQAAQTSRIEPAPVILMSPQGQRFDQSMAQAWSQTSGAILVCGRYEGIDQRFIDRYVTAEVSIGDFVLSGGEFAALAMIDASVRLLPGVLNDERSAQQDSFNTQTSGLLDCPHYTRPEIYQDGQVPAILMSGHHAKIQSWRREQSLKITLQRRPDLISLAQQQGHLSPADLKFLAQLVKKT